MCSGEMRRYMEAMGTPVAKATVWAATDAHSRKRGGANRIRYPSSPRRKRWSLSVGGQTPFVFAVNAISDPH